VTFRNISLVSHATTPGKIIMGGNVTLVSSTLGGTGTAVIQSTGTGAQQGSIDLGAATRTFTIIDGTPTTDVSIPALITGSGGFIKAGSGHLQLSGADTYTGGTTISAGILTLTGTNSKLGTGDVTVQGAGSILQILTGVGNGINNTAILSLFGGGTSGVADQGAADLGSGINETVNMLLLGGIIQPPGTYGSTSSSATFKSNEHFSGSGIVTVLIPEPASAGLLLLGLGLLITRRGRR